MKRSRRRRTSDNDVQQEQPQDPVPPKKKKVSASAATSHATAAGEHRNSVTANDATDRPKKEKRPSANTKKAKRLVARGRNKATKQDAEPEETSVAQANDDDNNSIADNNGDTRRKPGRKKKKETKSKPSSPVQSEKTSGGAAEFYSSEDESDDDLVSDLTSLRCKTEAPKVGEKIAIKCPADPPMYEAGWYAATVQSITWNTRRKRSSGDPSSGEKKSSDGSREYTLKVEWDGGELEEVTNPEWRVLGEEPDQRGHRSQKDAKLRPYFKHWVKRLKCIDKAESQFRLRGGRRSDRGRLAPLGKIEWVQCCAAGCGKWRALPRFVDAKTVMASCNNTWFCVLNFWDESIASCSAPQESGSIIPAAPRKQTASSGADSTKKNGAKEKKSKN